MSRYYIIGFFLLLANFGWSQSNTIQWQEDIKLEWKYFAGRAQKGSHHHALTASGVSIDMKQTSEDSVSIIVEANFYPKKSWLMKGKSTDHLLNHEQRHFDIAEIYRRTLIKSILTSGILESRSINKDIDKMYSSNDTALRLYQHKYDDETNHSQMMDIQLEWDKRIDDRLEELSEYDIQEIKFPLSLVLSSSPTQSETKETTKRKRTKRKRRG